MTKPDIDRDPPAAPVAECAFRPTHATAVRHEDGTWEALWGAPDGRGGEVKKSKPGFGTEADAMAHAKKLELIERLNRC